MQPQLTFSVVPKLPAKIEALREIVYNLWWTWQPDARALFRHLDHELWHETNHNPVRMLQLTRQARFEELANDDDFLRDLKSVHARLKAYLSRKDTYAKKREKSALKNPIAYFSAEFGFHESIPIYSGGLGILSGDHCKSASDLDLNFIAVTLFYRHGYFKQQINRENWQEAVELDQNFHHLPAHEVLHEGQPVIIQVPILDRQISVKLWKMDVGRIQLYLLDTDLPENSQEDRLITAQLYGGDKEMRIQQEIILGMGGVRALEKLGIAPQVYHMNEGHSAFLALERIRNLVQRKSLDFASALQVVASSTIFTTHTPVPAGNDAFSPEMMEKYFGAYPEEVGISFEKFFSLGQDSTGKKGQPFNMTILSLRMARYANGVSALHGDVSRGMWKDVWLNVPTNEVPITSVTNGIHTKTWLAPEFSALYDKHLGDDWEDHLTEPEYWRRVIDIPANELWDTHQGLKRRLIEFARERIRLRAQRNGEAPEKIRRINQILDPDILTIGFARRFATYKRATLLFSDPDRLRAILNNPEHPVQFLFAGKAHPADKDGKEFIKKVIEFSQKEGFEHRIAFIEDYDAYIGRRLVQGVDLWLNNPMRPLEASGTSGMKLPPNGGLNLSVLDGWWCEAYNSKNGWAIGEEILDGSVDFQNEVDCNSLYKLLEQQVTPLYYARPDGVLPSAWIELMRESIRSVTPVFNTHRMVAEYNERLYEKSASQSALLKADGAKNATSLARWKEKMRADWSQIYFSSYGIETADIHQIPVGESITLYAELHLGSVNPEDVEVQAYYGESIDAQNIQNPTVAVLNRVEDKENGVSYFQGKIGAKESGAYGLSFRVTPKSPFLSQDHELRLITWS